MNFISSIVVLVAAVSCSYGQMCPAIWAPVCGSDGKTYPSRCFLEAARTQGNAGLYLVHTGMCNSVVKRSVDDDDHCPEYAKNGICTLEYSPVCGSNGVTYPNKCNLCVDKFRGDTNLRIEHHGKCGSVNYCLPREKTGACTREFMPLCGSDGKTYANRCEFCFNKYQKEEQGGELNIEYRGECQDCPARAKMGFCERIYFPICGTDGVTYDNHCLMCKAIYDKQPPTEPMTAPLLTKKHDGACEQEATLYSADNIVCPEKPSRICTFEYSPICGSNGRTYSNKCFYCNDKLEQAANGVEVHVAHFGMCLI